MNATMPQVNPPLYRQKPPCSSGTLITRIACIAPAAMPAPKPNLPETGARPLAKQSPTRMACVVSDQFCASTTPVTAASSGRSYAMAYPIMIGNTVRGCAPWQQNAYMHMMAPMVAPVNFAPVSAREPSAKVRP